MNENNRNISPFTTTANAPTEKIIDVSLLKKKIIN